MADNKRTPREIEREVEQERAELRETVEELVHRFTFEDAWNRAGVYLRDNRSEVGHSVARVIKEKPLAVVLTAVGVGWLLFGPSQQPPPAARYGRIPHDSHSRKDHARTRAMLEEADFAARSARGPSASDATPDPWEAPSRTSTDTPRPPAQTGGASHPSSPQAGSPKPAGATGVTGAAASPGHGGTSQKSEASRSATSSMPSQSGSSGAATSPASTRPPASPPSTSGATSATTTGGSRTGATSADGPASVPRGGDGEKATPGSSGTSTPGSTKTTP
jgi:hypothetical protein